MDSLVNTAFKLIYRLLEDLEDDLAVIAARAEKGKRISFEVYEKSRKGRKKGGKMMPTKKKAYAVPKSPVGKKVAKKTLSFHAELTALLNRHSMENGSNTPDFLLASYLCACLTIWDEHTVKRLKWYEGAAPPECIPA